jgi:hypothetical protein
MQMLEIDGKVYMPRGQTTAGTPLNATLAANRLHWALQDFEQTSDLAAWLDEQAANARSGEWQARAADDALGFYRDGVFVLLGHLV